MNVNKQFLLVFLAGIIGSLGWLFSGKESASTKKVGDLNYVFIPAGLFTMGCINGDTLCWEEELPQA